MSGSPLQRSAARRGTVLIVVAGITALMASMGLAFILRIREGAETSDLLMREAQARIMLHAACAYILEASRLGYGPDRFAATAAAGIMTTGYVTTGSGALAVREGFGWIDVRDADGISFGAGATAYGPRDQSGRAVWSDGGVWPDVGGTVICPMYRWTRPPEALRQTVAYNPIMSGASGLGDPRWGRPLLLDPDPQPAVANGWPDTVTATRWGDFVGGDATPVSNSTGVAWFRVHRVSAATFIVTCGAGGTLGFKDWAEVLAHPGLTGVAGGAELFSGDQATFDTLQTSESRLWYEVRWSGAVRPLDFRHEEPTWWRWLQNSFAYRIYPVNSSQYPGWGRTNRFNPDPVGTISYIQRLESSGGNPLDAQSRLQITAW